MNIAVLLDGTWKDAADRTNVAQIHSRVARLDADGRGQATRYDEGVGTGTWNRLRGGVLGHGLDENIVQAYRFVTERHRGDDDRIYLIGHSRGAFTARSLAGMITKCGLVDPDALQAAEVFARYRRGAAVPGLHEMRVGDAAARTAQDHLVLERSRLVRIRFVGVFDTVGALGIPGGLGRWLTRRRHQFHDTALSGLVDHACHAVAIDEHRRQFAPSLWTGVPVPVEDHATSVEQRWFIGAHSDVGGGGTPRPHVASPLSVIAREWIVERAVAAGLVVDPPARPLEGDEWRGPVRDSYGDFLGGLARFLPGNGRHLRPVRRTLGETVDGSVLRRWGVGDPPYRPRNPGLPEWVQHLRGHR